MRPLGWADPRVVQIPVISATGLTTLMAGVSGLRSYVVGAILTLSADGTITFQEKLNIFNSVLSGPLNVLASGGFVLSRAGGPYWQTQPTYDLILNTSQPCSGTVWVFQGP